LQLTGCPGMAINVILTIQVIRGRISKLGEKMKIVALSIVAVYLFASIASADVFVTSDGTGTYVGGLPGFYPGGTNTNGTPTITTDGFYFDGTSKKKHGAKKWQKILALKSYKLLSSQKTYSK